MGPQRTIDYKRADIIVVSDTVKLFMIFGQVSKKGIHHACKI